MIAKRMSDANSDATRDEQVAAVVRIAQVAALAAIAALVVNALIRIIAVGMFDASGDDEPMMWGAIVAATLVATAVAALVYKLLGRFARRPITIFRIVAAVVLVLSLVGPLTTPDVDGATRVAAVAMHLTGAGIVVGLLTTLARVSRDVPDIRE